LCVDVLGGAPGVLSARYATLFGRPKSDQENNRVLLENLASHDDRRARFVSALVAVRSADDPEPLIAFGRWEGEVLRELRGEGDSATTAAVHPSLGQTVAELGAEKKNTHSHRAIASRQMLALMREVWRLG
jgi:XTP/dITP diphosphohydrolase